MKNRIYAPQNFRFLLKDAKLRTSRSSGKGGQNVNKVETKVELIFNVKTTTLLTDTQKEYIFKNLAHKIDTEGILHVVEQHSRSQLKNKEQAEMKFLQWISKALQPVKIRKATKLSEQMKLKNKETKQLQSNKKAMRKKINYMD